MLVCPEEPKVTEVEECSSYDNLMMLENGVDDCYQRYIAKYLYSIHHKGQFYLGDTEALIHALYEFCLIHLRTMHRTQDALSIT